MAQIRTELPGGPGQRADSRPEPLRVIIPSPIGQLGIEFRGTTVTRIVIQPARPDKRNFKTLKEIKRSEFLDEALGQLLEYFAGARQTLDLAFDLAPSEVDPFTARVLREAAKIPYGRTQTYQKIAALIGQPGAYRLVRSALAENPIPILIPCHRVVPKKGGPGSYIGGERKKRWLLRLESRDVQSV